MSADLQLIGLLFVRCFDLCDATGLNEVVALLLLLLVGLNLQRRRLRCQRQAATTLNTHFIIHYVIVMGLCTV